VAKFWPNFRLIAVARGHHRRRRRAAGGGGAVGGLIEVALVDARLTGAVNEGNFRRKGKKIFDENFTKALEVKKKKKSSRLLFPFLFNFGFFARVHNIYCTKCSKYWFLFST